MITMTVDSMSRGHTRNLHRDKPVDLEEAITAIAHAAGGMAAAIHFEDATTIVATHANVRFDSMDTYTIRGSLEELMPLYRLAACMVPNLLRYFSGREQTMDQLEQVLGPERDQLARIFVHRLESFPIHKYDFKYLAVMISLGIQDHAEIRTAFRIQPKDVVAVVELMAECPGSDFLSLARDLAA